MVDKVQRYRSTYLAAAFIIADAIGLAAFSITGALKSVWLCSLICSALFLWLL